MEGDTNQMNFAFPVDNGWMELDCTDGGYDCWL